MSLFDIDFDKAVAAGLAGGIICFLINAFIHVFILLPVLPESYAPSVSNYSSVGGLIKLFFVQLVNGVILGLIYAGIAEKLSQVTWKTGAIFGFLAATILSRQVLEALLDTLLIFDWSLITLIFPAIWAIELFTVYTILGIIIDHIYQVGMPLF